MSFAGYFNYDAAVTAVVAAAWDEIVNDVESGLVPNDVTEFRRLHVSSYLDDEDDVMRAFAERLAAVLR